MYLKSLTLKGFKSFADPTTLELEPGVTVVVGPNGSGKSNVVDAVAWVLGAQGPRVVRSAKMDDVIFAGTAKRAALGRAEVSLTIDNSSHRLPIDFNEVTVTRTLFRTGESEYAINGAPCRLLDVQELLSDTGVGRQQHVIVGQGQLDAVLVARPEDRRMIIEEAAGVLKFRRRKERAERRLESSETSLSRLTDLLREVSRQLKPLERQAASVLRHATLATELRSLRLYLYGRELAELDDALERFRLEGQSLDAQLDRDRALLAELDDAQLVLQGELGEERRGDLAPAIGRLAQLEERIKGLGVLITERRRARAELVAILDDADGALALENELGRVVDALNRAEHEAEELVPKWEELARSESGLAASEAAHVAQFGLFSSPEPNVAASEKRRELVVVRELAAGERENEARTAERVDALSHRLQDCVHAETVARATLERLSSEHAQALRADEHARTQEHTCQDDLSAREQMLRSAEQEQNNAAARVEALELALDDLRARTGVERLAGLSGVIGTLLDVIEIDDDFALAFEAAVEGTLDAVLVSSAVEARAAIAELRASTNGGAVISLSSVGGANAGARSAVVSGATALRTRVRGSSGPVDALLDELIGDVSFAPGSFDDALDLALRAPQATIVTADGDRFSPRGWRISAGRGGATRSALENAKVRLIGARAEAEQAARVHQGRQQVLDDARLAAVEAARELDRVSAERTREEALVAALREQHADLERTVEAMRLEHDRAVRARVAAADQVTRVETDLEDLERIEAAQLAAAGEAAAARRGLDERARALGSLRQDLEVQAAALEERRSLLVARRNECAAQIATRQAARERAEARRDTHGSEDLVLHRLSGLLDGLVARCADQLHALQGEADRRAEQSAGRLERLSEVRRDRDGLEREITSRRDRRQRIEIEQAEARVRHEAGVERLARDLDAVPQEALRAERPALAAGIDPAQQLRELERELRTLGPVNPLAGEELAALQERHGFLQSQLEDVRSARRELNQVIAAVDREIVDVFSSAFSDVESHFANLVGVLFPGGTGALTLTAPDDLLASGVEIEARPAGRNVRRLSLLSGGERALTAIAFLFAVFRSRPSPFYLLDEVEAALDEVNLLRFLDLLHEFRDEAQLVVVSHQKKTMEIADALYGISMQPGGASKVVSETLRDRRSSPLSSSSRDHLARSDVLEGQDR